MATSPMPSVPLASATNGSPGKPVDVAGTTARRPRATDAAQTSRSRTGAVWVGVCIAAVVLVALIIFMLQNTQPVLVSFLGMQGTVPLAVALLIAGVGVGIIALIIGTARITQLRRRLRRID